MEPSNTTLHASVMVSCSDEKPDIEKMPHMMLRVVANIFCSLCVLVFMADTKVPPNPYRSIQSIHILI